MRFYHDKLNEYKYELCQDTVRKLYRLEISFWIVITAGLALMIYDWNNLTCKYPLQSWFIGVFGILSTGRILIYFSCYLSPGFRVILKLMYFILSTLWAAFGTVYFAKSISTDQTCLPNAWYYGGLISCTIACYMITFKLRHTSIRALYNNTDRDPFLRNRALKKLIKRTVKLWEKYYENTSEGISCVICFEEFESRKKIVELPVCQHLFHIKCLRKWLKIKFECPCCKFDLNSYFSQE